jgi:hypothetical protein
MRLENIDLNNEFFESIKDTYPELSYSQIKDIIYGPWNYLKTIMESDTLEKVRLKYFGVFQVYPKRAKYQLDQLKVKLEKGKISIPEFNRIERMILKFLNNDTNKGDNP